MQIEISRWKETGKYYDMECIYIPIEGYFDAREYIIEKYKGKWDGYITVNEVQEDGFLMPLRLVTKEELDPNKEQKDNEALQRQLRHYF